MGAGTARNIKGEKQTKGRLTLPASAGARGREMRLGRARVRLQNKSEEGNSKSGVGGDSEHQASGSKEKTCVSGAVSVQALMGGGQHYRSGERGRGGGTEQRQVNAPSR